MTRDAATRRAARRSGAASIAVALLVLATACTSAPVDPEPTPRPVTEQEAQLLAVVRFENFDAGTRLFSTSVTERASELSLQGWFDYGAGVGYASATGPFEPQALVWDTSRAGVLEVPPDDAGDPPLPMPPASAPWSARELDPATSRLDTLLAVIGSLGNDRPDNPLLVQQTGALWLRDDEIDGTPVTVFAAPPSDEPPGPSDPPIDADTSSLRLWVAEDGLLLRAEIRLGTAWETIDMPAGQGPPLTMPDGSAP